MSENTFRHYRTDTFTMAAVGFSTAIAVAARWIRNGHLVTLVLPLITGVSNAVTFTLTGLPDEILPSQDAVQLAHITDNGAIAMGTLRVAVDSDVVTLGDGLAAGGFTASGGKGLAACVMSYVSLPR